MGRGSEIDAMVRMAGGAAPEAWAEEPIFRREGKAKVTIRLDHDVVAWFRAMGPGWHSRVGAVLRLFMLSRVKGGVPIAAAAPPSPVEAPKAKRCGVCRDAMRTATGLRKVLREKAGVEVDLYALKVMSDYLTEASGGKVLSREERDAERERLYREWGLAHGDASRDPEDSP